MPKHVLSVILNAFSIAPFTTWSLVKNQTPNECYDCFNYFSSKILYFKCLGKWWLKKQFLTTNFIIIYFIGILSAQFHIAYVMELVFWFLHHVQIYKHIACLLNCCLLEQLVILHSFLFYWSNNLVQNNFYIDQ